jgi:hypothetical protein
VNIMKHENRDAAVVDYRQGLADIEVELRRIVRDYVQALGPAGVDYRLLLDHIKAVLSVIVVPIVVEAVGPAASYLVACALIELTGGVCAGLARDEPQRAPDLDQKLGELRLFVASTTAGPQ